MPKNQRLPFDKRVKTPPAMRLMARDIEVIEAVYEYRFLLRDQIERLFFKGRNMANYRLQRLYQHGFLNRIYIPEDIRYNARNTQAMYCLDEAGADLLAREAGIPRENIRWHADRNKVREFFIEHLLKINDVRIGLTLAAKVRGDRIMKWVPDWELKEYNEHVEEPETGRVYPVFPDAYFVYERGDTGKTGHFFLELDRGTMENRRFAQKVKAYMLYFEENGHEPSKFYQRYGTHSIRVLTVVPSQRRLRNLKATTEKVGGAKRYWFCDYAALAPERILEPVWEIAGEDEPASLIGR